MRRSFAYNPALDGLRALAVAAVVAQHAGFGTVGSYGVITFFVISGYLITGLLLAEHERRGTLDIAGFYRRRFARLGPALLVVLAVTVGWLLCAGHAVRSWIAGLLGALTYTTDVLEQTAAHPHISTYFEWSWSLAIEEQFYLLWPLLLVGLLSLGRRWGRGLLAVLAAAVVVTAWVCRAHMMHAPATAHAIGFSFRSHMDGIALGALIAIVAAGRMFAPAARRATGLLAAGAAALLALAMLGQFRALWAADARGYGQVGLLCAVLVTGLVAAPSGRLGRVLGAAPLAHLGRLSYGLYLWNMLFRNAFTEILGHKPAQAGWAGVVWLLALLAVCEASFRWIETPLRRALSGRRHPHEEPASSGVSVARELVPAR